MGRPDYVKPKNISLKNHPELDEGWVQEIVAEDPTVLGLGDLILKDKERSQPGAGRLDLLLQDPDDDVWYEVEIQLGKTDPSHIIRTLEYWDVERKRYPQYEHVAVLVAEDITSRFLNVISLFNGVIPLIAIQMNAVQVGEQLTLLCTTVLDQRTLGYLEDEEEQEPTDRSHWERRGTAATLGLVDQLLRTVKEIDAGLEPKYNRAYIGLARGGKPCNFVKFRPRKQLVRLEPRMSRDADIEEIFDEAGLDVMGYRDGRYVIRLLPKGVEEHADLLREIIEQAHRDYFG